ncbi:MAG: Txe/YoeB family addiction module toxin [Flavobacteriales bacterium]|nr:Txe/YoeB family addiction module toxin [Flavobacteriales bacterium]
MEVKFTDLANEHLNYFNKLNDEKLKNKIENLLKSIIETPFKGIGKPEPLRYQYSGYWSRRVNKEHRLVYRVENEVITVYSLKGHY